MLLALRTTRWLAAFALSGLLANFAACGSGDDGATGTGGKASSSAAGVGGTAGHTWTMGPPFATNPPPFAPVDHPLSPTAIWGTLASPYPTNAEWMNLVTGSGA